MRKVLFVVLFIVILSIWAQAKNAQNEVKFVEPKIQAVDFKTKELVNLNTAYNKELVRAREVYKKVVTASRNEYLKKLKMFAAKVNNKEEKALVKAEIERINIELAGGSIDVRDESQQFVYGKLLMYKIKPTDKWIKIGELKEGDTVIVQFSGKISRDIKKYPLTNYKSDGCKAEHLHTVNLKLNDVTIPIDTPPHIEEIKTDRWLGQYKYIAQTDGPFYIGYPLDVKKAGVKPHLNGRGHLDVKMKITRK